MSKTDNLMKIEIVQVKSSIGIPKKHKAILKALGLKKIGKKRIHSDSDSIRGAINKINHLIEVKEVNSETA